MVHPSISHGSPCPDVASSGVGQRGEIESVMCTNG